MEISVQNGNRTPSINPALVPFSKMASVGVPMAAIIQKMQIQGIEDDVIQEFSAFHKNQM